MNETVLGFGKRHERVPAISRFPDAAIAKPNQSMVSIRGQPQWKRPVADACGADLGSDLPSPR